MSRSRRCQQRRVRAAIRNGTYVPPALTTRMRRDPVRVRTQQLTRFVRVQHHMIERLVLEVFVRDVELDLLRADVLLNSVEREQLQAVITARVASQPATASTVEVPTDVEWEDFGALMTDEELNQLFEELIGLSIEAMMTEI